VPGPPRAQVTKPAISYVVRPLIDLPRLVVLPGQVRSGLATLCGDAALCARPEMACRYWAGRVALRKSARLRIVPQVQYKVNWRDDFKTAVALTTHRTTTVAIMGGGSQWLILECVTCPKAIALVSYTSAAPSSLHRLSPLPDNMPTQSNTKPNHTLQQSILTRLQFSPTLAHLRKAYDPSFFPSKDDHHP